MKRIEDMTGSGKLKLNILVCVIALLSLSFQETVKDQSEFAEILLSEDDSGIKMMSVKGSSIASVIIENSTGGLNFLPWNSWTEKSGYLPLSDTDLGKYYRLNVIYHSGAKHTSNPVYVNAKEVNNSCAIVSENQAHYIIDREAVNSCQDSSEIQIQVYDIYGNPVNRSFSKQELLKSGVKVYEDHVFLPGLIVVPQY